MYAIIIAKFSCMSLHMVLSLSKHLTWMTHSWQQSDWLRTVCVRGYWGGSSSDGLLHLKCMRMTSCLATSITAFTLTPTEIPIWVYVWPTWSCLIKSIDPPLCRGDISGAQKEKLSELVLQWYVYRSETSACILTYVCLHGAQFFLRSCWLLSCLRSSLTYVGPTNL
jgi:hypothetical protein